MIDRMMLRIGGKMSIGKMHSQHDSAITRLGNELSETIFSV